MVRKMTKLKTLKNLMKMIIRPIFLFFKGAMSRFFQSLRKFISD